jgi:hypothetical protein
LHVAELLEREGHPLKAEVSENGGGIGRGKIVGIAAGTMLVAGAVAASALGLSGAAAHTHNDAGGQPVPGAAGHGSAGGVTEYPAQQVDNQVPGGSRDNGAVQSTTPQSAPSTQARPAPAPEHHSKPQASHHSTSSSSSHTQQPQQQQPEQQQPAPQQSQQPAEQHQQGGLGQTLQDVVTPVTNTLDNTLQPALSMIPIVGGLLGG